MKACGQKLTKKNVKVEYFYCNRSGFFKSESKGLRSLKTQGSSKMNAYCTAGFQLFRLDSNQIKVTYTKTHYGHRCSLGYLPIPREIKQQIAVDLVQGISFDKVLDKIRDNVGSFIERSHLVTKKDLHNIEQSFDLKKIERHKDDAMSVHLWVQECISHEKENPVLFYKPQGQTLAEVGTNKGLGVHDFALVLQTPLQCEMLKTCGNNQVICVDATHGTNSYDFLLLTVLVIDELGEGFPVAWCYSNKEDTAILTNFFQHLKERAQEMFILYGSCLMMQANTTNVGVRSLKTNHKNYCVSGMLTEPGEKEY